MKIEDKLKMLDLFKNYYINKINDNYVIEHKSENIMAKIENMNSVKYYITDCYNSGIDELSINIYVLKELEDLVNILVKEGI